MSSWGQLKSFKTALRVKLEINPRRSFTIDELCKLYPDFEKIINDCPLGQISRLQHWLSQENMDQPIVNLNAEAPRFGIVPAKKDTTRQKNYGLCDSTYLREKILDHNQIPYEALSRDRNDVLNERRLVDIQVMEQLPEDQKEEYAIACGYDNASESRRIMTPRNSTTGDYYFTSVWGLIRAIMHGKNTDGLKAYSGLRMTILNIYNKEKRIALEAAHERAQIVNYARSQWVGGKYTDTGSIRDTMDNVLANLDIIIEQNNDLKESNQRIEGHNAELKGHLIEIKSDVKTMIGGFNK